MIITMVTPMELIIYSLAVTRLTTLVTHDQITLPAREKLISAFNPHRRWHRWIVYLLGEPDGDATGCPWCVSIWISAITCPALLYWHHAWLPAAALAASQISGMIFKQGRS